jgi:hypothetical protein
LRTFESHRHPANASSPATIDRARCLRPAVLLALLALAACGPPLPTETVTEFSLMDVNPNSPSAGQAVTPHDYAGKVSGWFFGHSDCLYCRDEFAILQQLQDELTAEAPGAIFLLGINAAGLESQNLEMTNGRTLPWLQDTAAANVWGAWDATWRDVVIVGAASDRRGVYNLTSNDLSVPANYAELKKMLLDAR